MKRKKQIKLNSVLEEKQKTLHELAAFLFVDTRSVRNWLRAEYKPRLGTRMSVGIFLGITDRNEIDSLFEEVK